MVDDMHTRRRLLLINVINCGLDTRCKDSNGKSVMANDTSKTVKISRR